MEKLNFGYLLKNIPTTKEKNSNWFSQRRSSYLLKKCVGEISFFINNKAEATENDKQVFGYDLKTGKSLQQVKELIQFEDDLVRM